MFDDEMKNPKTVDEVGNITNLSGASDDSIIFCVQARAQTVRSFLPVGTWDCYHGIRRRIQGSVWIVGGVLCSPGGGDIGLRYVCNWLVRIFMV